MSSIGRTSHPEQLRAAHVAVDAARSAYASTIPKTPARGAAAWALSQALNLLFLWLDAEPVKLRPGWHSLAEGDVAERERTLIQIEWEYTNMHHESIRCSPLPRPAAPCGCCPAVAS